MQLHRRTEDLEERRARVLLVSFAERDEARRWLEQTRVGFPILLDEARRAYAAYGLERSALRSWSPATLAYYARALLRGERLRASGGDPHQLGGDFVVDGAGIVRLAYRSRDPVDRPSVAALLQTVDRCP